MLSLKKQSKTGKTNKFLGAILGICLLMAGCEKNTVEPTIVENKTTSVSTTSNVTKTDSIPLRDGNVIRVVASDNTSMYELIDGVPTSCGIVEQGIMLDVSGDGEFLKLAHEELYVQKSEILESDRWIVKNTHLLPLGIQVTTDKNYEISDYSGKCMVMMNGCHSYEVYAMPTENDPRYGVLFQNEIVFIKEQEILSVSTNEDDVSAGASDLPVLMYHFFYNASNGENRIDANYIEVNELEEQLSWLENEGYQTLTMSEIALFMEERAKIPEKSVAITIDDGDPSVHEYGYDIIKRHKMNATLFLITGWGDKSPANYDFWEMREDGLELQSHGFLTHQGGCEGIGHGGRLLCMDHDEGVEDTLRSFDTVDGGFVYCYPFGDINDNAISIVRDAGTKLAFTTAYGKIDPSMDPLALPRIRVHGGNSLDAFISSIQD